MTPAARFLSRGGRTSSPPRPTLIEFRRILLVPRRRLPTRSRSPLQGAPPTSESGHGRRLGGASPEHWLPGGAGGGDLNLVAPCERAQRKAPRSKRSSTLSECPEGRG